MYSQLTRITNNSRHRTIADLKHSTTTMIYVSPNDDGLLQSTMRVTTDAPGLGFVDFRMNCEMSSSSSMPTNEEKPRDATF